MLGILAAGVWAIRDEFPLPVAQQLSAEVQDAADAEIESGAITVYDQPAGTSVIIESLTVPPPGVWIAVRDVTETGLGNVLGAVRVTGPRTNITVPLLRKTESNRFYVAQLYRDDGGNTFDLASDSVYIDFATGAPVITRFSTTR